MSASYMCASSKQLANMLNNMAVYMQSRIIMADSKTCKCQRKQLLLLAQLVNENKDIIKGKFGVGITSKTKGDTFLKAHYCQMFLKCLCSKADFWQQSF